MPKWDYRNKNNFLILNQICINSLPNWEQSYKINDVTRKRRVTGAVIKDYVLATPINALTDYLLFYLRIEPMRQILLSPLSQPGELSHKNV